MIRGSGTLPLRKNTNIPTSDAGMWCASEEHLQHRGHNRTEIQRDVLRLSVLSVSTTARPEKKTKFFAFFSFTTGICSDTT